MSKLTINLDATALGSSGCILALYRTVVLGLKEPAMGASLIYGVAVHKYIDTMYKTKGHIPTARDEALKAFRVPKIGNKSTHLEDEKHMITTCFNLWEIEIKKDTEFDLLEIESECICSKTLGPMLETGASEIIRCKYCNGKGTRLQPATEVTFSIPYYEDDFIIVNLCGTIDRIGKIKNGAYLIRDWKSTSSWDDRNYFKTYELSRQLRIYRLALKLMAKKHPESILGQIGNTNVGAQIQAIFIKPSPSENKYKNSDVMFYSDKEIEEFEKTLLLIITRLSKSIEYNYYPKDGIITGACENKWGKCKFWNTCVVSDEIAQVLLKRDFVVKDFNPLAYNE